MTTTRGIIPFVNAGPAPLEPHRQWPCTHGPTCPVWVESQLEPEALEWLRTGPTYLVPVHRDPLARAPRPPMKQRTRAILHITAWVLLTLQFGAGVVNALLVADITAAIALAGWIATYTATWLWALGLRHRDPPGDG